MNKKTIIAVSFLIALFAFFLFSNLASPPEICTDEKYYAIAGREILNSPNESNIEHHPPLGKYLIGAGIKLVGFTPIGWRMFPAITGSLGLLVVYLLTKEIFVIDNPKWGLKKNVFALLTVFILSFDFLYFVMSRLAMLDIFVTFFILLTTLFLWKTFQTQTKKYLILTGVAFGLALGSKWTAGLLFPLFLFLLFQKKTITDTKDKSGQGVVSVALTMKDKKIFLKQIGLIIGIAAITYLLLYTPYLYQNGLIEFVKLQGRIIYRMFWTSDTAKAGTSPLSVFIWTFFPANTLYCYFDRGNLPYTTYLISNPFILWTFWPVVIYNFFVAIRRKELSRLFIVATILSLYIPWMVLDRVKYFFYILPAIPFLVILITQTIADILSVEFNMTTTSEKSKKTSYFAKKRNPDILDKIMIKIDTIQIKTKNSQRFKLLSDKFKLLINNKQLMLLLITCYLLFIIILFILYYPLLAGIPVSDSYRKAISFFWPFLVQ